MRSVLTLSLRTSRGSRPIKAGVQDSLRYGILLAKYFCTLSIELMYYNTWGDQTVEAYPGRVSKPISCVRLL